MRRALIASLLLHAALFGALFAGLPSMGERLPPEEAISVEIVTDAQELKPSPLPPKAPLAEASPLPQRQAAAPSPPPPPAPAPPERQPEPKPAPPPPPPPPVAEPKPAPPPPPPPPPEPKKVAEAAPEPKPAPPPPPPPPPPEPKKAEAPPSKPAPPAAKPPPEPPKPKPAPERPVEPAAKPDAKPTPPRQPTPRQEATSLDALLASVETQYKRVKEPEKREAKGVSAERGGTSQAGDAQQAAAMASALVRMISEQVTPCWNIPLGAQEGGIKAELHIVLGPDGGVRAVEATDGGRMASDPAFRTFAESAIRAVRACSPLKLPPEQYQVWRNIIFNFDPSMLTG